MARHNPFCFGGKVLGPWQDTSGTARYACLFAPAEHNAGPLPLLVFLHGSLTTADSVRMTGLLDWVSKADLGGKAQGFILLTPEGRYTTHFYPGIDSKALGWDNWYRQLDPAGAVTVPGSSYEENADAAAIDHFIHEQVATGRVDTHRIYLSGWSNGAAMALLYALQRPWVAAAAVYSAPDPFAAFGDPCEQTPVAGAPKDLHELEILNPRVALMHVRNQCDIGGICPNGTRFYSEMSKIGVNLEDMILDSSGKQVSSCDPSCGTDPDGAGTIGAGGQSRGFYHHVRWPAQWNERMLRFLKEHPLGATSVAERR